MLALLSTSHDYLVAFVIACLLVAVPLLVLILGVGIGWVWGRPAARRLDNQFDLCGDELLPVAETDLSLARQEHFDLASRHRAEDEMWWVA